MKTIQEQWEERSAELADDSELAFLSGTEVVLQSAIEERPAPEVLETHLRMVRARIGMLRAIRLAADVSFRESGNG